MSGKVTVKDRAPKVGPETRPRPKRPVGEELSPLQTAMVAAEVKVADWLAQNELPLALKETVAEDDGESVKSDVPVQLRSLKGVCKCSNSLCAACPTIANLLYFTVRCIFPSHLLSFYPLTYYLPLHTSHARQ